MIMQKRHTTTDEHNMKHGLFILFINLFRRDSAYCIVHIDITAAKFQSPKNTKKVHKNIHKSINIHT